MFTSSTKREFRHFHVVVVQRRQRNVQKSVMHVQSCCFTCSTYCVFCRSRSAMKTKTLTMTKVSQEDPVSGFLHTQYGEWFGFCSLLGTFRLVYESAIVRVRVCKTRSCASDCYSNLATSCSVLLVSLWSCYQPGGSERLVQLPKSYSYSVFVFLVKTVRNHS